MEMLWIPRLIILVLCVFGNSEELDKKPSWWHDIFGDGIFRDEVDEDFINVKFRHKASSTEDLKSLFHAEKELVKHLNVAKDDMKNDTALKRTVDDYLQGIDYDLKTEAENYVHHPVNSVNLLKRLATISQCIPKLNLPIQLFNSANDAFLLQEDYHNGLFGLADLREYSNINTFKLAKGIISNYITGEKFYARSGLSSSDLMKIASQARKSNYLEGYVDWMKTALKCAEQEGKDKNFVSQIKRHLKGGKDSHDHRYKHFYDIFDKESEFYLKDARIRERPYKRNEQTIETQTLLQNDIREFEDTYYNVFDLFGHGVTWTNNDYSTKADLFSRRRMQRLCQGTFQRPAWLDKELKCACIHHKNPYLKLAPLKFELKHSDPEIAIIHDFASGEEIERVKNLARGKMHSTPYVLGKKAFKYSKLRTSKVMYQNERLVEDVMPISDRIEWLTQLKLKHEQFASENFQLMNYGIGGKISPHVDVQGEIYSQNRTKLVDEGSSESLIFGGSRIITFMLYMSTVEVGGHTVFPQAGISVKPEKGNALYWFNVGAQNNLDTRIRHLGCPVSYGDKWILNKWIKSIPNFRNFPCLVNEKYYSVYRNHFESINHK